MERTVNVNPNISSAKPLNALMNSATDASPNGEGYMHFYTEKRKLSPL